MSLVAIVSTLLYPGIGLSKINILLGIRITPGVIVISNTTLVFLIAVRMLLILTLSSSWATVSCTVNMSVFWRYENIGSDNREVILTAGDNTQTVVQFQKGYWSFQKIQERLKEENVLLTQNEYNNTCRIYSATHSINLGSFGLLIGFVKDTVIAAGVCKLWTCEY